MQLKNLAVLVALPFALVACGGGGGSSSSGGGLTAGSTIESQFIDAPVKGLKVEKLSGDGETGANGMFSCKAGEEVSFWLKEINGTGLLLGKAFCGSKIYIDEFGTNANAAGALIQSLSTGTHGTRTELDLTAFNATTVDVSSTILGSLDDTDLQNIVADVKAAQPDIQIARVTLTDARTHMNTHLPKLDDAAMAKLALAAKNGVWVTMNKVSGSDCDDKVSAKIKVEELAVGDKKTYKFSALAALGWDAEDGLETVQDFENACNSVEYDCMTDIIASRYITGRSLTFSDLKSDTDTYSANMPICLSADGEDSTWGQETCDEGFTKYLLDKDYSDTWNEGFSVALGVNDTGYSIRVDSNWSGLDLNLGSISGGKIGMAKYSGSCAYSATGTLE